MDVVLHSGVDYGRGIRKVTGMYDSNIQTLESNIQQAHEENRNARLAQEARSNDNSQTRSVQDSLTITDFRHQPFTSLADVKACTKIPNKYRCRVKFLRFSPSNLHQSMVLSCVTCYTNLKPTLLELSQLYNSKSCKACATCNNQLKLCYMMRMLIEDDDVIMDVILYEEDAVKFFDGIEPLDMLMNSKMRKYYQQKLSQLIDSTCYFLDDPSETNSPCSEICLKSYHTPAGTMYRVFGTAVV